MQVLMCSRWRNWWLFLFSVFSKVVLGDLRIPSNNTLSLYTACGIALVLLNHATMFPGILLIFILRIPREFCVIYYYTTSRDDDDN